MAKSVTFRMVVGGDVESVLDKTVTISDGDAVFDLELVVPASTTDQLVTVTFTLTGLKGYMISSDQAITIETNSSSAPDDTIVLVAGEPLFWWDGMHEAMIFTDPVTALYLTTGAISASANVRIIIVKDSTP
jgi:hypothetical protein